MSGIGTERSRPLPPAGGIDAAVGGSLPRAGRARRATTELGIALGVLLLAGGAAAQTPDVPLSSASPPTTEQPIAPIPPPPVADPRKLALGEQLFQDTRLSRDGSRACASCHDVRTNGADGHRHDQAFDGAKLPFNTSTVFNAALSFRLGWEGSFRTLETQAEASLDNPDIMGTSVAEIVAKLDSDPETARQFGDAYGRPPDRASLLDAIATYERSLLTPGSRFDRWLQGDAAALSVEEQDGYRLFRRLGCVSCHQGVNVGANLFERHGIFHPLASPDPQILRVPSLRNVATTPPYFHDGSAPTLDDAVRKMAVAQLNQTLSDQQAEAIVGFLRSLTGTYRGDPVIAAQP
jgi:cytochrome c peroxidase